jgi:hypothetical protein
MVARHSAVRRRGLTAYKVYELLTGEIRYPVQGYSGYGNALLDQSHASLTANYISDQMREDWEANREALMAFWRSGKLAYDFSEFGLNVMMKPWRGVSGDRRTLPWAATALEQQKAGKR